MTISPASLLDLRSISTSEIQSLFIQTQALKKSHSKVVLKRHSRNYFGEPIALMFFEPSTRTRLSFQMAAQRAGFSTVIFEVGSSTSLEKGETLEDSFRNVSAMKPAAIVLRAPQHFPLRQLATETQIPIFNAGWGVTGHPTQALLDQFSLYDRWGTLEGKRLLVVGDVSHSRVMSSHLELSRLTGLELAVCGPTEWLERDLGGFKKFVNVDEGLAWAHAVMPLRVQFERHENSKRDHKSEDFRKSYFEQFGIGPEKMKTHSHLDYVLHPGPVNYGIELDEAVARSSKSLILEQVFNGVCLREALLVSRLTGGQHE
jgi:aspartate carbamoyltransferase catalytic subunit